jgi:UbiD family decarboxylases
MRLADDLREFLARLEQNGLLRHVKRRVSSEYEIAAVLKKTKGEIPLCFDRVDDYECPLVAGLGGTREMIGASLGVRPDAIVERFAQAIVNPMPVKRIEFGPVQETIVPAPFDIDRYFPVLKYNALDSGRFLVSGVMIAKDISGKRLYSSIRRMQYLGKNRCCLLVTSSEMQRQIQYYEEHRQPMELAVMFGVSPAVVLGSQISTHYYHADKLDVTGALIGRPLEVVRCKTVDIDVLAGAETVLEGRLLPWVRETEGPFGELGGYYGKVSQQPVVEFTAMTCRNKPIAQTILASSCEEKLPEALSREVALISGIRQTVPGVRAVHITMPGVGRFHAVIQLEKTSEGDGKQALLAAFSADKDLKHVVAVDTDVDLFNPEDVEWAIATRVQADLDVFIVPGAMGSGLEPSHNLRGVTAKMGIDATGPIGKKEYIRTHIPGEEKINLNDYIS